MNLETTAERMELMKKIKELIDKEYTEEEKPRAMLVLYTREYTDVLGYGCLGCAVEAFGDWLENNGDKVRHNDKGDVN